MKLSYLIKKTVLTGIGIFGIGTAIFAQNNITITASALSPARTDFSSSFSATPVLRSFSTKDIMMEISPWEKRLGITGAFGESSTSLTLGFSHLYGFGSSRRFKLGYGVRLSSFFGSNREFTAAPADLASEDNPESFFVESSQSNAINLGLYTDYSITENVLIGFNIDLIGFSFGSEKDGLVEIQEPINASVPDKGKPTSFNALLIGNNDIGTLNSEFWIGYRIASNLMVRGGFSYLFVEYTTEGQYQEDNDRFRYKAAQGMVGVSYTF